MNKRVLTEYEYWEFAAQDPSVDERYICEAVYNEPIKNYIKHLTGKTLEIGCGVGRLQTPESYGIDISPKMIEIAKRRKPTSHFLVTDGRSIPYPDESFNNVFCVLVFQHLPLEGVYKYIAEAGRVLVSGGTFVFQFIEGKTEGPFSQHHYSSDIQLMLLRSGFSVIKKEVAIHPQWLWITAQKL